MHLVADFWEICTIQDTTTISFNVENTTNSRDIPVSVSVDCPALSVNVSNNRIRRCFDEVYWINYINQGTQIAEDAYIIVKYDPFMEIVQSSIEGLPLGNNEYRYELGDIGPLESEAIRVVAKTNCENTALGQTHCVEAFIFPDINCNLVSNLWSMAKIASRMNRPLMVILPLILTNKKRFHWKRSLPIKQLSTLILTNLYLLISQNIE